MIMVIQKNVSNKEKPTILNTTEDEFKRNAAPRTTLSYLHKNSNNQKRVPRVNQKKVVQKKKSNMVNKRKYIHKYNQNRYGTLITRPFPSCRKACIERGMGGTNEQNMSWTIYQYMFVSKEATSYTTVSGNIGNAWC